MSPRTGLLLAAALIALPAAARDPLAGRVAGAPQRCIPLSSGTGGSVTVADRRSVTYRDGTKLWRNVPIDQCSMRPLETVIVEVFGGQLCRNDRFRTLSPGLSIPSAPCRLGDWVPYVKAK